MPIYDYLCTACDHRADILHRIHDPGPRFCPNCGAEGTLRKQFAAPTIHFKGSGWAKKDRGASKVTRAAAAAPASGGGKSSGGEAGSRSEGSSRPGSETPSGGSRSEGSSSEGSGSSGGAAGGSDGSGGSGTSGGSGPTSARKD